MSGLDNLNTRLKYRGDTPQDRLNSDKLIGLKKALLYSYQAATAVLSDEREFRCLINPNKETGDYDNKIISIPYKDVCLNPSTTTKTTTSDGEEEIGLKCGDVFTWKETDTHWLVFLKYLEENAYFRAQIRRCDQQVTVNGTQYWAYLRGPTETSITWNQKSSIEWNDLNFSLVMYITSDENTTTNLHRFDKVKVADAEGVLKTWQVVGVNPYYGDGICAVYLDEYYENTIAEAKAAEDEEGKVDPVIPTTAYIDGLDEVAAYSTATYTIKNSSYGTNGKWYMIQNSKETYLDEGESVTIDIVRSTGTFTLEYRYATLVMASKTVIITAL